MADRTPFADLTRLNPADALSADSFGLQDRNPTLLDYYLRLLFTGKHDGHAALANPVAAPTLAVDNVGGQIPADLTITVGYTLTDGDGGETAISPLATIDTQAGLTAPDTGPTLTLNHAAGTLMAGSYEYAVTLTDGVGGETSLGVINDILIPAGNATNEIVVSGLDTIVSAQAAVGWRLWRSIDGQDFHLIGQGATATFTDDGSHAADCGVSPPATDGATRATSILHVTVPTGQGTRTVSYSIYASVTGSFDQASLLGTYPVAEINTNKAFTSLTFLTGTPPEISTAMAGLPKITNAELASGGGGGGGGSLLPVQLAWYMLAPEHQSDPLTPNNAIIFEAPDGTTVGALYMAYDSDPDVYQIEVYDNHYDASKLSGDTTHFNLNASTNAFEVVDAGNWHVSVTEVTSPTGNWLETGSGAYVEFDYTIVNANWTKLVADLLSINVAGDGLRIQIDKTAGTFSVINLADGSVLASVGAAEGYVPPAVGQNGYMILAKYGKMCTAWDAHDDGTGNFVAGPAYVEMTLAQAVSDVVNQVMGGWGVDVTDPAAVHPTYWSASQARISRSIRARVSNPDSPPSHDVVLWTDNFEGGGLRAQDWQPLYTGSVAPYALENGWIVVNPVGSGLDYLSWRYSAARDELEIIGKIDGSAATAAIFATLPTSVNIDGDTEHEVILIAADGTRSVGFVKVGADRNLSLVQPATPTHFVAVNIKVPLRTS